nr:hypothetical protein [Priestia megaterium]
MKKITGIILTAILILSFGITSNAETSSDDSIQVNENKGTFENMELIDSKIDEKTGVQIDVYGSTEPLPNVTPFAGNGRWDYISGEDWVMNGNWNDVRIDGVRKSNGGDYSLVIPPHEPTWKPDNQRYGVYIELWEDDPMDDDYVASYNVNGVISYPNYHIAFRDLNKFVDGANKKAEFYTTHQTTYKTANNLWVKYFD